MDDTGTRSARHPYSDAVEDAAGQLQTPRQLSDRIAMGRAIWRELVIGFTAQLGELRLGFPQLAALYVLSRSGATTGGGPPWAPSRLVAGLVRRGFLVRLEDAEDRRQRSLELTADGRALLAQVD